MVAGDALLAPSITRRLVDRFAHPSASPLPSGDLATLTTRETEVLGLVARGMSNAEIAAALVVTEATVKTHVAVGALEARGSQPGTGSRARVRIRSRASWDGRRTTHDDGLTTRASAAFTRDARIKVGIASRVGLRPGDDPEIAGRSEDVHRRFA